MPINDPPFPKVYNLTVISGTGFGGPNLINIPGIARFSQITNNGTVDLSCRLNGDSQATFDLPANTTQIFNSLDIVIKSIDFADHISGSGANCIVQVICGITSGS